MFSGIDGKLAQESKLPPVVNSLELQRILALPRRDLIEDQELVEGITEYFKRAGGDFETRWIQAASLYEAAVANGLFGMIGVGWGKTLITLLMPTAMDSKRAVLLLPAQLMKKTLKEIDSVYNKHFKIPLQRLHIHSYEQLSRAETGDLLEEIQPDLIILDEAHCLKDPSTARGKRFKRYMDANPGCRLVVLSGTMITRKITECAYLCEYALGKGSPLPRGYQELRDWGGALDVKPDDPKSPGALKKFCEDDESPREGFWRRMAQTQGVIMTQSEGFEGTIIMRQRKPKIPKAVEEMRKQTRETWEIGDQVITEATHFARVMKQLAQGHYLRWDWSSSKSGERDEEWLELRRDWTKELQHFLRYRSKAGLDSGLLVTNAVKQGKIKGDIQAAWQAWSKVKHRPEPKTVPVWIDDFLIQDALRWGEEQKSRAIIWVDGSLAVEQAFREAGLPVYGSGDDANDAKEPVIVCGVRSQGTGKNLQYQYHKNLFFTMISNGGKLEQTMGRTHRDEQPEGEVEFSWNAHTEEMHRAFASALDDANFAQEGGQRQKFLLARHV